MISSNNKRWYKSSTASWRIPKTPLNNWNQLNSARRDGRSRKLSRMTIWYLFKNWLKFILPFKISEPISFQDVLCLTKSRIYFLFMHNNSVNLIWEALESLLIEKKNLRKRYNFQKYIFTLKIKMKKASKIHFYDFKNF